MTFEFHTQDDFDRRDDGAVDHQTDWDCPTLNCDGNPKYITEEKMVCSDCATNYLPTTVKGHNGLPPNVGPDP